jgi:hypothetical protein
MADQAPTVPPKAATQARDESALAEQVRRTELAHVGYKRAVARGCEPDVVKTHERRWEDEKARLDAMRAGRE